MFCLECKDIRVWRIFHGHGYDQPQILIVVNSKGHNFVGSFGPGTHLSVCPMPFTWGHYARRNVWSLHFFFNMWDGWNPLDFWYGLPICSRTWPPCIYSRQLCDQVFSEFNLIPHSNFMVKPSYTRARISTWGTMPCQGSNIYWKYSIRSKKVINNKQNSPFKCPQGNIIRDRLANIEGGGYYLRKRLIKSLVKHVN